MNEGRTVFSQFCAHLPSSSFHRCVARYDAERYVKRFSCWDQFLCMAFAQCTHRESLRDIESALRSLPPERLYHMGIRGQVSRTTLADANGSRDDSPNAKDNFEFDRRVQFLRKSGVR